MTWGCAGSHKAEGVAGATDARGRGVSDDDDYGYDADPSDDAYWDSDDWDDDEDDDEDDDA